MKIPPQYKGVVLSTTEMPQAAQVLSGSHSYTSDSQEEGEAEAETEGLMEELADFDEFVIWGHVALPDETTDPYLRAIEEYTAFAEAVCIINPVLLHKLTIHRFILWRRKWKRNSIRYYHWMRAYWNGLGATIGLLRRFVWH